MRISALLFYFLINVCCAYLFLKCFFLNTKARGLLYLSISGILAAFLGIVLIILELIFISKIKPGHPRLMMFILNSTHFLDYISNIIFLLGAWTLKKNLEKNGKI